MSDDPTTLLTPAKPKRAPAKKARPAAAAKAEPTETPAVAKKATAKKVSVKKVPAKKIAAKKVTAKKTTAAEPSSAPSASPVAASRPPAPKRPVRKAKTDSLLPPPVVAPPTSTQPELPFHDGSTAAPAKPRRAAAPKRKVAPAAEDAPPPPPPAPAPSAEAPPAPYTPAPDRDQRRPDRRNDRYGNRDRNRNSDRNQNASSDRQPRERPSSSEGQPTNETRQANQSSDPSSQDNRDSAGQQEESNRSRRWKERRNRFKKWKERRRGGPEGTTDTAEGDAPPSGQGQGNEAPPAPIVLGPPEPADGILELTPKGYGFLRQRSRAFAQFAQDPFVSPELIRQYGLREGMFVKGQACKAPRGPQVTEISEVNNRHPEAMRDLPLFEELKAINPNKRIQLETDKNRLTTRVIDMFTPVGRGQRGLIVAPPRTGKTTLLQHIAESVTANHPSLHLMILLVDERPEEVTEFKRALPNAEIFASSNDQDVKSHTRISQFAIERAKRLVECGEHVFILMDSITRLARAFNNAKSGGATMSGGVGVGALEIPRRLFAAARNTREAGSLTILATALIETGSRMDDLIFQEFKGTGNMELVLDRKIAEQFYYPAVNIFKSGTRREELLLQAFQLDKIHMLRRGLAGHKPIEALQRVLSLLERYPGNAQMLVDLPSKS